MKKLLKLLLAFTLFIPFTTSASSFAVPWQATSTTSGFVFPNLVNGNYYPIQVPYLVGTTTATSSLAGGLNITSGCFSILGVCFTGGSGTNFFTQVGNSINQNTGSNIQVGTITATSSGQSTFAGNVGFGAVTAPDCLDLGDVNLGNWLMKIDCNTQDFLIGDLSQNNDGNTLEINGGPAGFFDYMTDSFTTGLKIVDSTGNAGFGTSSPGTDLSIGLVNGINISTISTSTFPFGMNIKKGCYAIAGTCIGTGGGGSGTVTSITATSPLTGGAITTSGSIGCQTASGSQAGCLSSADWNTFSSKGIGTITSLTGDVAGSGTGVVGTTLATVNGNVGSFGGVTSIPNFTVNAKGLVTAAGASTPSIPVGDITGTLPIANGGTGLAAFTQGWLSSTGGVSPVLSASTSPTVNYITATSTTATSTFNNSAVFNNQNNQTVTLGPMGDIILSTTTGAAMISPDILNNPAFEDSLFLPNTGKIVWMGDPNSNGTQFVRNGGDIWFNQHHDQNGGELQLDVVNSMSFNGGSNDLHTGTFQMGTSNSTYDAWNLQYNGTAADQFIDSAIGSGGTGYTVGDTLTVPNCGGYSFTLSGANVSGGVIISLPTRTQHNLDGNGFNCHAGNGQALTGGTGNGATLNISNIVGTRPAKKFMWTSTYATNNGAGGSNVGSVWWNAASTTGIGTWVWYDNDPGFGSEAANSGHGRAVLTVTSATTTANTFTASSTTFASSFPYASTTALTATTICLTGDICRTTWPSGGGGSSVGPINTLQATDGAGGFLATGTPQLTVGNILATSTKAVSSFGATTTSVFFEAGNTATNPGSVLPGYSFLNNSGTGIGLNSDNTSLDLVVGGSVKGSISAGGTIQSFSQFAASVNYTMANGTGCALTQPCFDMGTASNRVGLYRPNPNQIGFIVHSTEAGRWDNTGNLGIGTTTPSASLSVATTSLNLATGFSYFMVSSTTPGVADKILAIIASNGNFGIGTSSPFANLSLQSNLSTGDAFVVATSTGASIGGYDNDGHRFTAGPAPAISSCGTGTGTVVGDDQSGIITTATAATACTMTFAKAYRTAPACNVTDDSLVGFADISSISTTAVTFGISSALTGGHLYYSCSYHRN